MLMPTSIIRSTAIGASLDTKSAGISRQSTHPVEGAANAAAQFEAVFISQMMRSTHAMLDAIRGNDSIFRDESTSALRDHLETMLADRLACKGAFGIANLILCGINQGAT